MDSKLNKNYQNRKIIIGVILFVLVGFVSGLRVIPWQVDQVYASSAEHGEKKAEHGEGGHGGHDVHHAPPIKYYIHWAVLLFALTRVALYLKKKFKSSGHDEHHGEHAVHEEHGGHGDDDDEGGGHHGIHVVQEAKGMAALLCGLVIFLFFVEYAPSLAEYHESVPVSLFKFAVKMVLGVCLTTFGILGMDEH